MSEIDYLAGLIYTSVLTLFLLACFKTRSTLVAKSSKKSASFSSACSELAFAKKIKPFIEDGIEITIPIGSGVYINGLLSRERQKLTNYIDDWMVRGVKVTVLITNPPDSSEPALRLAQLSFWMDLNKKYDERFKVIIFKPPTMTECATSDLEALHECHPILITKDEEPHCMWIEGFHPDNASIAHSVEFVAPSDMNDEQKDRFTSFASAMKLCIDNNTKEPGIIEIKNMLQDSQTFDPDFYIPREQYQNIQVSSSGQPATEQIDVWEEKRLAGRQ